MTKTADREFSARYDDSGVSSARRRPALVGPAVAFTLNYGRRIWGATGFLRTILTDLVYPPACVACRAATAHPDALCARCWAAMRFIERPFCNRLGTPFTADLGVEGLLSPGAIADPPVFNRARAVVRFEDGPARQLVHRLKYGDRLEIAKPMGRWMARAATELLDDADVLVPVPMHPRRLRQRTYNQAALLAAHVSRHCGVPVERAILRRSKPTPPQVGKSRQQRALNVQGAFAVDPASRAIIDNRAVVVVDDVMTSGATANAAARALLRAGAARVDVLVFAQVVTADM